MRGVAYGAAPDERCNAWTPLLAMRRAAGAGHGPILPGLWLCVCGPPLLPSCKPGEKEWGLPPAACCACGTPCGGGGRPPGGAAPALASRGFWPCQLCCPPMLHC